MNTMSDARWPVLRAAALCALVLAAGAARGEALDDPMRPPSLRSGAAGTAVTGGKPRQTGLQAVLISASRRLAIVDGVTVAVGSRVRGAEVIRITDGEVVLREGARQRVLRLAPEERGTPLARRAAPLRQALVQSKKEEMQ